MTMHATVIPTRVNKTLADWELDTETYSTNKILVTIDQYYPGTAFPLFKFANGIQAWEDIEYAPMYTFYLNDGTISVERKVIISPTGTVLFDSSAGGIPFPVPSGWGLTGWSDSIGLAGGTDSGTGIKGFATGSGNGGEFSTDSGISCNLSAPNGTGLHSESLYGDQLLSGAVISDATATKDTNAVLDIQSITKGVLFPRLTTAQVATLGGLLSAGQKSMLIFNATTGNYQFWSGSSWLDVSTSYSANAYTDAAVASLVASAPSTLDTLNELATALGDDPNFATTVATSLGNRLRVDTAAQGLSGTEKTNAKTNVDLNNVDNTSDINKPVSTAQAAADALKLDRSIPLPAFSLIVSAFTPVSGQSVYFSTLITAPPTTAGVRKTYVMQACTIVSADFYTYATGAAGTGEAWSLYFVLNNTTPTLIQTISAATQERHFINSALSISLSSGDFFEMKFVNPTWTIVPVNVIGSGKINVTY